MFHWEQKQLDYPLPVNLPSSVSTVTSLSMKHPCIYQYPHLLFTLNAFIEVSVNGIAHQNFPGRHLANNLTKIFFFRFILIYVYVSVCHIGPQRPGGGFRSPGLELRQLLVTGRRSWDVNSGSLQEKQVLLGTGSFSPLSPQLNP